MTRGKAKRSKAGRQVSAYRARLDALPTEVALAEEKLSRAHVDLYEARSAVENAEWWLAQVRAKHNITD